MALRILITKFKFRQHILRANSPNLMLAKLSCYIVCRNYEKIQRFMEHFRDLKIHRIID